MGSTEDFLIISAFSFIFCVGVIGNLSVCYAVTKGNRKKNLSTMQYLIYRLAVVDVFASIFNPTVFIYWQATSYKAWHFGEIGCKVIPSFLAIAHSLSIGLILIISVDRCHSICQPFMRKYTKRKINVAFVILLIIACCMEIPRLMHAKIVTSGRCVSGDTSNLTFKYPKFISMLFRDTFCLIAFIVVSYRIYGILYDKESMHILNHKAVNNKRKAFKMTVLMTTIFIVLVYPRDIFHMIYMMDYLAPTPAIRYINIIFKIMASSNSIANVFIYSRLHNRFRRCVKTFFIRSNDRLQKWSVSTLNEEL